MLSILIALGIYIVFQSVLLGFLDYICSVLLTSICSVFVGYGAMSVFLCAVDAISTWSSNKTDHSGAHRQTHMSILLTFAGVTAAILCAALDAFYYSNRDVKYWVYINNSAFPMGFLGTSALLTYFILKN